MLKWNNIQYYVCTTANALCKSSQKGFVSQKSAPPVLQQGFNNNLGIGLRLLKRHTLSKAIISLEDVLKFFLKSNSKSLEACFGMLSSLKH